MTNNQIAYARHLEESRHNRATESAESMKARAQYSQAQTAAGRAYEDARHNRETERVNWWSAQETGRHNLQQESINAFSAQSTARFQSAQSQALMRNAAANEQNSWANVLNAQTRQSELAESIRHNNVYEQEVERHNRYTEQLDSQRAQEIARANRASESIGRSQVSLGFANLGEVARSNQASESIRQQQVAEETRSNRAREANQRVSNLEQRRANKANEGIKQSQLDETKRANLASEGVARRNATSQRITAYSKAFDTGSAIARTFVGLGFGGF